MPPRHRLSFRTSKSGRSRTIPMTGRKEVIKLPPTERRQPNEPPPGLARHGSEPPGTMPRRKSASAPMIRSCPLPAPPPVLHIVSRAASTSGACGCASAVRRLNDAPPERSAAAPLATSTFRPEPPRVADRAAHIVPVSHCRQGQPCHRVLPLTNSGTIKPSVPRRAARARSCG